MASDLVFGSVKRALLVAGIFTLLPIGCADDEASVASTLATRGESCHSRLDCAVGLSCINKTCTVATYAYQPTGKECVTIDCRVKEDCCAEPPAACVTYQQGCALDPLSVNCTYYEAYCTCDLECLEDQCVSTCDSDVDCGTLTCVSSKCVECANDTDCLDTELCVKNACVEKCTEKVDCPYFHDCQAGTCKEVGCHEDRECIAAMKNILARCAPATAEDPARQCQIPCQTDVECQQSSEAYNFMACVAGFCLDIGCDSDDECLLRTPAGVDAACRPITNL